MPRALHLAGGLLSAAAVLVLAFVAWFDWAWVAARIEQRVTEQTGRRLEIGELDGELGWTTRLSGRDVRLANAEWAPNHHMLRVPRMQAVVPIWSLINGPVRVQSLALEQPVLRLRVGPRGRSNWDDLLGGQGQGGPRLERVLIQDAAVHYRNAATAGRGAAVLERLAWDRAGGDRQLKLGPAELAYRNPQSGQDVYARLQQLRARPRGAGQGYIGSLDGELNGEAVNGELALDPRPAGAGPMRYQFAAEARWGAARLSADGTLGRGLGLAGLQAQLRLSGDDPARLSALLPLTLSSHAPYRIAGSLSHRDRTWRLDPLQVRFGRSRAQGHLTLNTRGPRPLLAGELKTRHLHLGRLVQALGREQPGRSADGAQVFSTTQLNTQLLRRWEADLRLTGDRVVVAGQTWDELLADVRLRDGTLRVEPLRFQYLDGGVRIALRIDAGEDPVRSRLEININRLDLLNLLAKAGVRKEGTGQLQGYLRLSGTGRSPAAFAASADGDVTLVIRDGTLDEWATELASQDLVEALAAKGGEQQTVPLRCAVADFRVEDGRMRVQSLIVDAAHSKFVGSGVIRLGREAWDLYLDPRHKDFSALAGQATLHVHGPLLDPRVDPQTGELLFSFLTPVELGLAEDAPCKALIQHALNDVTPFGLAGAGSAPAG